MPEVTMELALGTVQFGLAYGIAGRNTPVPEVEVRSLLAQAWEQGISLLDTAAAYGDIEARLVGLMGARAFRVVTKIPSLPPGLSSTEVRAWASGALAQAHQHLGDALSTVMLHRADDLLGPSAEALWEACSTFGARHRVQLGVSCYDPGTLSAVRARFPVVVAQLPGNALDQRLAGQPLLPEVTIHLRSAFLQGLLLMPLAQAQARLPVAAPALARWHAWCQARQLPPLAAALGVVKGLPGVSHCVVGVDHGPQLAEISVAWQTAPALLALDLATADPSIIDPRLWPHRS